MRAVVSAVLVTALLATGCGSSGSGRTPAAGPSPSRAAVRIVAVGDSDATGIGDETGRGWVGRYADLVKERLHVAVSVDNLAVEGMTSDTLRSTVTSDATMRGLLERADVVLVGIGGADLNAGDDAMGQGACTGKACYADLLQAFDANLTAIAAAVRALAPDALLRAMSLPNAVPGAGTAIPASASAVLARYQAVAERTSVCRAMQSQGGRCVDVLRAFNGADGLGDAYAKGLMTKEPCCYPSAKGQQLVADLLVATGLGELAPSPQPS